MWLFELLNLSLRFSQIFFVVVLLPSQAAYFEIYIIFFGWFFVKICSKKFIRSRLLAKSMGSFRTLWEIWMSQCLFIFFQCLNFFHSAKEMLNFIFKYIEVVAHVPFYTKWNFSKLRDFLWMLLIEGKLLRIINPSKCLANFGIIWPLIARVANEIARRLRHKAGKLVSWAVAEWKKLRHGKKWTSSPVPRVTHVNTT